jgi:hypothetical protein
MPDDSRYEAALTTALAILDELTARPDMPGPAKVSTVTFIVLRAMREVEERRLGRLCPEPGIN